jgi:hypothetical protein
MHNEGVAAVSERRQSEMPLGPAAAPLDGVDRDARSVRAGSGTSNSTLSEESISNGKSLSPSLTKDHLDMTSVTFPLPPARAEILDSRVETLDESLAPTRERKF